MSCMYATHDVFELLDGTSADGFRAHASSCAECEPRLREAQVARRAWRQARTDGPDDFALARLDRAMAARLTALNAGADAQELRRRPWFVFGLAAAGAIAAATVVLWRTAEPRTAPSAGVATAAVEPSVRLGDLVEAPVDAERTVTVAAARVIVAAGASCRVTALESTRTEVTVLEGSATFDVDKRAPGSLFEVRADDVLVTVRGTRFTVSRAPGRGEVEVSVEHGRVDVSRRGALVAALAAGDRVTVALRTAAAAASVTASAPSVPSPVREAPPTVVETTPPVAPEEAPAAVDDVAEATRPAPGLRADAKRSRRTEPQSPTVPADAPAADSSAVARAEAPVAPSGTVPPAQSPPAKTPLPAPTERIAVETESGLDAAHAELKSVFRRIGNEAPGASVDALEAWLKAHPDHHARGDARYAIGYCEHVRGNRAEANRIFSALRGHRWLSKIKDLENPRRPF